MNAFVQSNKKLVTYALILIVIIPIFGFNFLITLIGNFLLLLFLIPLLLLLIGFLTLNNLKSMVKVCGQCGTISLGNNTSCINCGSDLNDKNSNDDQLMKSPGERTIEVRAEEVQ